MDTPTLISSWGEYENEFGGLQDDETDVSAAKPLAEAMGHSVYAFFQNGGTKAYIVRIANTAAQASGALGDSLITFDALSEGDAGNDITVTITRAADVDGAANYDLSVDDGSGDAAVDYGPGTLAELKAALEADATAVVAMTVHDAAAVETLLASEDDTDTVTMAGGIDGTQAATGTLVSGTVLATFTAINEGTWGDDLTVVISVDGSGDYQVLVGTGSGDDFEALESFEDVSLTSSDSGYLPNKVNDISELVTVDEATMDAAGMITEIAITGSVEITFGGGNDGTAPTSTTEYDPVFELLLKYRDISMILLPGQYWDTSNANMTGIIDAGVAHCESIGNRMIFVDPKPGEEYTDGNMVKTLGLPSQTYCAMYYPWVQVANSAYNIDTNPGASQQLLVSPGAFAAGMWAKTDGRRGVWKAPAGVESALLGAADLEFKVENPEQDYLNPLGVNAIRAMPGYGTVIWGSRTLATKANPEWRYVPVRRTAMFIEESLYNGIQWAVFEPNDHRLWSSLRTNIESFMNGLFRAGAFQGEKASDAYFVRCNLGDTMTQGDIDAGKVVAIIGFAPLKPAEFVIVRLQQIVGQQ